jgi:hypothetical protein
MLFSYFLKTGFIRCSSSQPQKQLYTQAGVAIYMRFWGNPMPKGAGLLAFTSTPLLLGFG